MAKQKTSTKGKGAGKASKMKSAKPKTGSKTAGKAKNGSQKSAPKASQTPQDLPGSVGAASKTVQTPQQPQTPQNAAQATGNPFRSGSSYHAVVEGLRSLGVGKMHPLGEVVPAIKKAMGSGWAEFASHKSKKGLTAEDRATQNIAVVARKDYGKPLRAVGFEVRFDGRKKLAGLFKL